MTAGGWIFMLFSLSVVIALVTFCFYRVLSKPSTAEHIRGAAEASLGDKPPD